MNWSPINSGTNNSGNLIIDGNLPKKKTRQGEENPNQPLVRH